MKIEKTALLIIDMQNDVMKKFIGTGVEVEKPIQKVLKIFRDNQAPVIHVLRVHRPDGLDVEQFRVPLFERAPFLVEGSVGAQVVDSLKPLPGEIIIEKQRFSAFFQTNLLMLLQRLGVKRLVICGVQTPNCIRSTAVDAIGYDFETIVLEDATASLSPDIHKANLFDMQNMGISVLCVEELFTFSSRLAEGSLGAKEGERQTKPY